MDRIGRYKIVRELGRGAMGVVYHAIDPNIGRPVAIKTIQLGGDRTPEEQERLRERLFREARSAGILSHPGIVTIYDVEQEGDLAYIAMEYVDGPTLDQLLSEREAVEPELMFSILAQTAVALDYAHQKGIVHRDIKPANIMIAGPASGTPGTVKITDFGIAKVTASEQFTMTGAIVGTPHYMSPEQVQGQPVDGRSDQFSLAVIAYEILTGEKPYTGEHLTTVVYKIVAEEPAPPHRLNPTLGGAIEVAMRKGLAKKADGRFRTCQEFAEALEKACAATAGWHPMPRGGGLNEPTLVDAKKPAVVLPPSRRRLEATGTSERGRPRKSGFLTFLLAMLVVAGLLALIGWQAAPWLLKQNVRNPDTETPKSAAAPRREPAPAATAPANPPAGGEAKPAEAPPSETKPAEGKAADTSAAEGKPHPMPPATPTVAAKPPEPEPGAEPPKRPSRRSSATPQAVTIISSPGGATATMDGNSETACTTPCSIDAAPGRHTVALSVPGYQLERREVDVGSSPQEMPAVVLHPIGGTVWLTSVPPGAAVMVNGKRIAQVTPAQIPLSPGTYKITVEKDGKQASGAVEVRSGIVYLKLSF
ncbi:MAG TPA: serine/threonine-protein kinase [Bryobacteraceae bacterium]|jgi:serine/threonine protein kinase|nr:serine/threonine-protein kinase [Bryobacteraceae bacterium]